MAKKISRKLTLATVAGKAGKWFAELMKVTKDANGDQILPLANIMGMASGFVPGATEYGEYVKFRGMFRGTNLSTGEISEASECILPAHLGEAYRAAIELAKGEPVSFAVSIAAQFDASAATKYVYIVHNLLPDGGSNPLDAIEQAVKTQTPLLPAPRNVPVDPAPAAASADPAPVAAPAAAPASGKRK